MIRVFIKKPSKHPGWREAERWTWTGPVTFLLGFLDEIDSEPGLSSNCSNTINDFHFGRLSLLSNRSACVCQPPFWGVICKSGGQCGEERERGKREREEERERRRERVEGERAKERGMKGRRSDESPGGTHHPTLARVTSLVSSS